MATADTVETPRSHPHQKPERDPRFLFDHDERPIELLEREPLAYELGEFTHEKFGCGFNTDTIPL